MKNYDELVVKAVAICFKPYLKPEEAMIYSNLKHTQFAKRCKEFAVLKNDSGYFKREDLNRMMSGEPSVEDVQMLQRKFKFK